MWVVTPLCPSDISSKYDIEIIYADSVSIMVGFGGEFPHPDCDGLSSDDFPLCEAPCGLPTGEGRRCTEPVEVVRDRGMGCGNIATGAKP